MNNNLIIKNARLVETDEIIDIIINNGIISEICRSEPAWPPVEKNCDINIIDAECNYISAGFIDLHTHLRDPGLTYKEDIESGTKSAIKGGITALCCMPNTNPVIDNPDLIKYILENKNKAHCNIFPVGAITKSQKGEELTDFAGLKKAGAMALSDDGKPVENYDLMREALIKSKENNILIMSHCEDLSLTGNESEDKITKRDIYLACETGARLHICHVSTGNSAGYIAEAKNQGFNITAETCPHYFVLTDEDITKYGVNAKMNPPLRSTEDKEKIIEAIKSGAIDCISTDHAPHSLEDKNAGVNGITGVETSFALGVTYLVKQNHITLKKLIELMTINPAKIIGIDDKYGTIEVGKAADFVIFNTDKKFIYDKNKSYSKSRNTPFHGFKFYGKVLYTIVNGNMVYENDD
ncbi:MAG: dihydroorotase [Oscillospiraceae bacterium]|nr:dihydroorotase [Oscillospiraceae bacterium]